MALTITVERDVIPGSQGPIKALGSFAQARPASRASSPVRRSSTHSAP